MIPRRTVEFRTLVRALPIGAALTTGLLLSTPGQAADESLLQPTPLILKDGRIANVSVHVLSFPPGQAVLGADNARRLDSLSAELATDCFLTAQVIGHVGSTEVGNDTLSAHRLARARADAVQASLIADGLPATAIASVWDWQFMVREPRATVWVFRLTPGEDCEGKPLEAAAPALVAGSEPSPAATPVSAPHPAAAPTSEARAEPAASREGGPEPAPPAAAVRAAEAPRTAVAVPAGPAPAKVPSITQALPAVSPKPVTAVASRPGGAPAGPPAAEPAAVAGGERGGRELPQVVAALPERPAESPAEPAAAGSEELVITFPTNSSYFPPGVGTQLQALLDQVTDSQRYQVILQASVSGSQKVVGAETSEEAAKYNQWLAERRVDRVRSWLDQNAEASTLEVKPEYRANDDSRRVVVRLVPGA